MIDPITPRIDHTVGTDPQSLFEVPFPFFSAADLTVSVGGIVRAQGAGYSVSGLGNPNGGRIRFAAPLSNTLVTIARRMPLERAEPILADDPALAQTLNGALDRQTALIQQVANDGTRALRQPEAETPQDMTLPAKAVRASTILGFDSAGSPVALTAVTPAPHAHAVADVTGLQTALDGKAAASHTHNGADITTGTVAIERLPVAASGTSSTSELVRADDERLSNPRAPLAHAHAVADVTGLQNALDGKAPSGHTHNGADITTGTVAIERLPVAASGTSSTSELVRADDERLSNARAPLAHAHAVADVTGLQNALDGKAPSAHTHNGADITAGTVAIEHLPVAASGIVSATALVRADDERLSTARAPLAHTHAVADVTGLQTALDGKAAAGHAHNATDIAGFAEAVDDRVAGLLTAGANITLAYDDTAGTLTIASTGTGSGSGSSGSSRSFITAGAVTAGRAVALRADGTVTAIDTGGLTAGPAATVSTGLVPDIFAFINAVAISQTQFLACYLDASANGWAVVGTVSGDEVGFGTPVQFNTNITNPTLCHDPVNNKFAFFYGDSKNGNVLTAQVASVSGSLISFGSPIVCGPDARYSETHAVYHAGAGAIVVVYRQYSPDGIRAIAGIISGNSMTFGSKINVSSCQSRLNLVYDSDAQRMVVTYDDLNGNNYVYYGMILKFSGTTITTGAAVSYQADPRPGVILRDGIVYVPWARKFVIVYLYGNGESATGYAFVGGVSGDELTFGAQVPFAVGIKGPPTITYDGATGKVLISYMKNSNSNGVVISGAVSNYTLTFDTPVTYRTSPSCPQASTSIRPGLIVNQIVDGTTLKSVVLQYSGSAGNWIGIASQSATVGQSVPCVLPGGIAGGLSDLTTGQVYYVGPNGSPAATGAFRLGRALSASDLLVG